MDPSEPVRREARGPPWFERLTPRQWLVVLVGVYFGVSLAFSVLRLVELRSSNWDLGIWMQSLWSTSHGHVLYEAGDYETYGTTTFLQVHPALLLFLFVPLYAALPNALPLFVVQSAVVALAAVPLYGIARQIGATQRRALLTAAIFLLWAPLLSANLYDVHLEAFLPLELFATFYLWSEGRYVLGSLVVFLSFVTIEAAPVLQFALGLFFLLPPLRATWARATSLWSTTSPEVRLRTLLQASWAGLRRGLRTPRVRASLGLVLSCVVAYYALRYIQFHAPSIFQNISSPSVATDVGLTPASLGLSLSNITGATVSKVVYWTVLFATVGFLPFRALRTLILAAPWMIFTVFATPLNTYVVLGQQYSFVAAAPLFIGVAYGLRDLRLARLSEMVEVRDRGERSEAVLPPNTAHASADAPWSPRSRPSRPSAITPVLATSVLLGVVALNALLSPTDPLVQQNPDLGQGYQVTYHLVPGFSRVQQLCALLPPGATVVATDDLFPFVADDVNAYSFLWYPATPPNFPFTASHLPAFALVSQDREQNVPGWLFTTLHDATDFGVLGAVGTTPQGTVTLYELNYTGPTTAFFGGAAPLSLHAVAPVIPWFSFASWSEEPVEDAP